MSTTAIQIPKTLHTRLKRTGKALTPRVSAPALGESLIKQGLDALDAHARVAIRDEGSDDNGEPLCSVPAAAPTPVPTDSGHHLPTEH